MTEITHEDLRGVNVKLDKLLVAVAKLETLQKTEGERLPFGEMILQINDQGERLGVVESKVDKLELTWAKAVGLVLGSGGIASVVTQFLQKIW